MIRLPLTILVCLTAGIVWFMFLDSATVKKGGRAHRAIKIIGGWMALVWLPVVCWLAVAFIWTYPAVN